MSKAKDMARIREIIAHEFDLELYLKQQEVALIERELERGEQVLQRLEQAIFEDHGALNRQLRRKRQEVHDVRLVNGFATDKTSYASTLRKRTRTEVSSTGYIYGRHNNGTFVRLSCPGCGRHDFANRQGFVNHCRLAHEIEFANSEDMARRGGEPVDEAEVPFDSPARQIPVVHVEHGRSTVAERPSIREFDEDIDLDLEREAAGESSEPTANKGTPLPNGHRVKRERSLLADTIDEPITPSTNNQTPMVPKSTPSSPVSLKETSSMTGDIDDDLSVDSSRLAADAADAAAPTSSTCIAGTNHPSQKLDPDDAIDNCTTTPSPSIDKHRNHTSTSESPYSQNFIDEGSRFYVKRKVLVGNVSKFIPLEYRNPERRKMSHKWMIYVTAPPQEPRLDTFIAKVRFYLHPSYHPNLVELDTPPFHLTQWGWGESPVRVQLFFKNKTNKPLDIIHHLRLDDLHTGKQVLGEERVVDVNLDRNTKFVDEKNLPPLECPSTSNVAKPDHSSAETPTEEIKATLTEVNRTALRQARQEYAEEIARKPGYCKVCGRSWTHHTGTGKYEVTCENLGLSYRAGKTDVKVTTTSSAKDVLEGLPDGWDLDSDNDSEDIDMGDSPRDASLLAPSFRGLQTASLESLVGIQSNLQADDNAIDWIWSVVGQLSYPAVKATDIRQLTENVARVQQVEDDQVGGSQVSQDESIHQRIVAGSILYHSTRRFLQDILERGTYSLRTQRPATNPNSTKINDVTMLTPYHILSGLLRKEAQKPDLTFLTNAGMQGN